MRSLALSSVGIVLTALLPHLGWSQTSPPSAATLEDVVLQSGTDTPIWGIHVALIPAGATGGGAPAGGPRGGTVTAAAAPVRRSPLETEWLGKFTFAAVDPGTYSWCYMGTGSLSTSLMNVDFLTNRRLCQR